jgi:hypothetical protein
VSSGFGGELSRTVERSAEPLADVKGPSPGWAQADSSLIFILARRAHALKELVCGPSGKEDSRGLMAK